MDKATVNKLILLEREVESAIEDDLRFKILDGKEYEFRIYNGDFGISIKKTQDSDKEEKELCDKIESIIGEYVHKKATRLQNQFANIKIVDLNGLK